MPHVDEFTGYDRGMPDEFSVLVNARLDEARLLLMEAADGRPLCRIDDGAGHRVESIKFREGAAAALADLRNALTTSGPPGALDRATAKWRDDLARHNARGSSTAWISYAQGGLAMLEDLRSTMAEEHR